MKKVAIFGVPRSGTSWLGQLFNSSPRVAYRYQPLFSYAFKDRLSLSSTPEEIEKFHADLLDTTDAFVLQLKNVSGNAEVSFPKTEPTHLVWKEVRYLHLIGHLLKHSDLQVIGILRHPCAVLSSWQKAPKEFDPSWDFREEWRLAEKKNKQKPEEFYGFEKWKEAFSMFQYLREKFAGKFTTVGYESLVARPETELQRLFDFAGLELAEQTKAFIRDSTSNDSSDPYGVFRAKKDADDWKTQLDPGIIAEVMNDLEKNGIDYEG